MRRSKRMFDCVIFYVFFSIATTLSAQTSNDRLIVSNLDSLFSIFEGKPGCAIGVLKDGKPIFQKGYGLANLEHNVPVSIQSVFEMGSVAMHITATAILLLEQEGKLLLDDAIQKHLSDFPMYTEGEVTIRHCLHHSSGIRDYLDLMRFSGRELDLKFDNTDGKILLQKQKNLTITPGSDYRYSHSNYLLLALIVEKISNKSIGEFAHQRIFEPLGMKNTFFYDDRERVINNRTLLYSEEEKNYKLKQNFNFTACGDGRLYSTIEDMMIWSANFRENKLGTDADLMHKLSTKGILNSGDTMSYAYGLEHGDFQGHRLIGHNGWWGGASSMFIYYPDDDLFVVTMGNNANNNAISKCFQASAQLLDEKQDQSSLESQNKVIGSADFISISHKEKESVCGSYFSFDIGYARKIYLNNDTLYYHDGEHEDLPLLPLKNNEFLLMDGRGSVKIRFDLSAGQKKMYIHFGERPPISLTKFIPEEGSINTGYTGRYYSKELEIIYNLKEDEEKLCASIGENQIACYNPLMKNYFNSAHDGYLKFERDGRSKIQSFTINDYSLGQLNFVKIE